MSKTDQNWSPEGGAGGSTEEEQDMPAVTVHQLPFRHLKHFPTHYSLKTRTEIYMHPISYG